MDTFPNSSAVFTDDWGCKSCMVGRTGHSLIRFHHPGDSIEAETQGQTFGNQLKSFKSSANLPEILQNSCENQLQSLPKTFKIFWK